MIDSVTYKPDISKYLISKSNHKLEEGIPDRNYNLEMGEVIVDENVIINLSEPVMGKFSIKSNILIGKLKLGREDLKSTFIVKIINDWTQYDNIDPTLTFGRNCYVEIVKAVNKLALAFCNKNNLIISDHFKSIRNFLAVAEKIK